MKAKIKDKQASEIFYKRYRADHPVPYFSFTNINSSARLEFELLNESNYLEIHKMFKGDDSPFVIEEYKSADLLKNYMDCQLNYHWFSPKKGGCNWLVKIKDSGEYIGLINLYNLNRESFNDNNNKCTIGFSTKKDFRKKQYTFEAVNSLIDYIFKNFESINKIIANTDKNNIGSIGLLRKLKFIEIAKNDFSDEEIYFMLLKA